MTTTRHRRGISAIVLWTTVLVAAACGASPAATIASSGGSSTSTSMTATTAVTATTTTSLPRTTVPPASTSTTVASLGGTGVQGTVLFSPVCPVERIPPDPFCAPRPGPARIQVLRADGSVVVEVAASTAGRFSIPVGPGTYRVTAVPSTPGPGRRCQVEPPQATVVARSFVTVSVTCDTGIR